MFWSDFDLGESQSFPDVPLPVSRERRGGTFTSLASCGDQSQCWGPLALWGKPSLCLSLCPAHGEDCREHTLAWNYRPSRSNREGEHLSCCFRFCVQAPGFSPTPSMTPSPRYGVMTIFFFFLEPWGENTENRIGRTILMISTSKNPTCRLSVQPTILQRARCLWQ